MNSVCKILLSTGLKIFIFIISFPLANVAQTTSIFATDTIIFNTRLPENTVYKLEIDSLSHKKTLSVWFSFVNDSGKPVLIDRISTGDGGSYAMYNGATFKGTYLKAKDTLTFCIFFYANLKRGHNRDVRIMGTYSGKGEEFKTIARFTLLVATKE